MALLQKALRGYSDFIGRFRGGQVGLQDLEVLHPTIAMEDFLNERKTLAFDTQFTAAGQVASITVPDGKQWRVHFVSCESQQDAGEAQLLQLHWRRVFGGATRYYPLDQHSFYTSGFGTQYEANTGVDRGHAVMLDIIIPAGDGLGLTCSAILTADNVQARFVCQISEYAL